MRTIRPIQLAAAFATVLIGVSAAPADILSDILGVSTAARDRATEARNNAANARDRATEARNYALTARDNAAAARDTATTARDTVIEMRENMRAGLDALSGTIEAAINEAIDDLEREVADEMAGRDAFVNGGGGETFRQQLVALLQNTEALLNVLNAASGMPQVQVSLSRETTLIQAIPLRTLYPAYRTMAADSPGLLDQFNTLLARAVADVQIIADLLMDSPDPIEGDLLDQELNACGFVLDHLTDIRRATSDLTKFAMAARGLGTLLKAAGTTEIHKSGAVWGWVGVSIKNNRVKKLGVFLDGIGGVVSGLTSYVSTKTRYCAAVGIEGEAREQRQQILANQAEILRYLKHNGTGNRP